MADDKHQKPFEVTFELEMWLSKAAETPTTPLTRADFDAIRERVRNRILSEQA
jgi:hypothetical protein